MSQPDAPDVPAINQQSEEVTTPVTEDTSIKPDTGESGSAKADEEAEAGAKEISKVANVDSDEESELADDAGNDDASEEGATATDIKGSADGECITVFIQILFFIKLFKKSLRPPQQMLLCIVSMQGTASIDESAWIGIVMCCNTGTGTTLEVRTSMSLTFFYCFLEHKNKYERVGTCHFSWSCEALQWYQYVYRC